jgi:filamentous hemagglutinin
VAGVAGAYAYGAVTGALNYHQTVPQEQQSFQGGLQAAHDGGMQSAPYGVIGPIAGKVAEWVAPKVRPFLPRWTNPFVKSPAQEAIEAQTQRHLDAARRTFAKVDAGKYDYLFGKVASSDHNAARSVQNAQQLAKVGVYDTPTGRSLLQSHFDEVVAQNSNILRTYSNEYGTYQVRESLFSGPGGFLKFETTWETTSDGLRLTTVIPLG